MYSFIQAIVLLQSARLAVWEMCLLIFWSVTYNYELSSSFGEASSVSKQIQQPELGFSQGPDHWGTHRALQSCDPRTWLVFFPTPHVTGAVLLLVHGFSGDLLAKTVLQTSGFGCSGLFLIASVLPNAKIVVHPFVLHLLVVAPGPSCWPCPSSGFSCLVWFCLTWPWSWLPPHRITWCLAKLLVMICLLFILAQCCTNTESWAV